MKKIVDLIYSLLFISSFFLLNACNKADGPVMNYSIATPDSLNLSIKQSTVTAAWEYPSGEPITHFIVQLARDEDFKNFIGTDTLMPDARNISFDSVGLITACYFRIFAQAENVARNSPFVSTNLELESILQPVDKDDVTSNSVLLKWSAPVEGTVTSVVLIPEDSLPMAPVSLSSDEVSAKKSRNK